MSSIATVLQFGWVYLRRYWVRLSASIFFGVLFALANSSFIWATGILTDRFNEKGGNHPRVERAGSSKPAPLEDLQASTRSFSQRLKQKVDPWLPRMGQAITRQQLIGGLLFLPLLVAFRAGSDYLGNYCMGWVSERVVRDIRLDLMSRLSTLSLDYFNRASTGDLLTRINTDTQNLLRSLRQGAGDLIKESLTVVAVFVYLCWLDPILTVAALVLLPLCLFPLIVLGKKAKRATKASLKASVSQSGQLVELFAGIRVVKAFGLEQEQLARFRKTSSQIVHAGMKGVQAKELVNPIIEVVAVLGLGALLLYIFQTGRSGQDLATFLTGVLLFFLPVKKLAGLHILFEQASVGVARLEGILNEKPTVVEPARPRALPGFQTAIVFDNVSFSFGAKKVLQNLHLTIPRGFKLGLAGESGCGKTTVLNLLFRFYDPGAGAIRLDGADIREFATADLRQIMALVSQEVVIFDQTVAENIACGKRGATREEVIAAAKAAHAHDFIMQLPEGYDTQVGERGVTLSGGQRQRLSIARAFVRDAPILVLDEATGSLDAKSEAEVQAAIDTLAEHRTVICVAHRLSTLSAMDQIVVLSAGQIVESGTFDELLQRGGYFGEMAARQGIYPRVRNRVEERA